MKYRSTRNAERLTLDQALQRGIAADGGLFMPESLPQFAADAFAADDGIHAVAARLLAPFFEESALAGELGDIVAETFAFPIPCTPLTTTEDGGRSALLELFHGPTAAFKDVGARFLAACLSRLNRGADRPLTILVATSGDTGGAVAAAFAGRENIRVAVLYPEGRVSARQEKQLTCWGDNVLALAVAGSFDDCQRLVKAAFNDRALVSRYRFSSANSINIGRLLPQCTYYADASLRHCRETGRRPGFIVPTGNLGNALACVLARDMGLPIGDIVLACNANRLIVDYLDGAAWQPRASVRTLASAMDVGNPGNMERLRALHGDAPALGAVVSACAVDDAAIEAEIRRNHREFGIATCPHTATATRAWRELPEARRRERDWILVATAHAAKFESIVEPLIGDAVPLPAELADILSRPGRAVAIAPDAAAFGAALDQAFAAVDRAAPGGDK